MNSRSWILPSATIPAAIALLASLAFFALAVAATFVDKGAIRRHVADAFRNGELTDVSTLPFNRQRAIRQWNDCLILGMLLVPYESRIDEVLFPKASGFAGGPCQSLHAIVDGNEAVRKDDSPYARYLQGARTLLAPLVAAFDIRTARLVLWAASYAILGAALPALWFRNHRRRKAGCDDGARFAGFGATLVLAMLAFYGIPFYGMSLSFAAADVTIYLFLLAAMGTDLSKFSLRQIVAVASILGAVIAFIEFLTGHAPLALAVLIAAVALQPPRRSAADLAVRCGAAAGAFVASLLLCFAIKIAVVELVFHYDLGREFASALSVRLFGSIDSVTPLEADAAAQQLGIDITRHTMYSPAAFAYMLAKLGYFSRVLGQGSLALGLAAVVLGVLGLLAGAARRWHRLRSDFDRTQTALLVAAGLVVPGWYLAFFNHTIIHASFMIRPLVATIAIGLWLAGCEIAAALAGARAVPAPADAS